MTKKSIAIVSKLFGGASLATLAVASGAGVPAIAAVAQPADFRVQADALLNAAYPADGPGGAVIVTRRGKVIYAAGRGLADLDAKRPITPDTPFKLGSIVKQFTAAVVLQLVAEGRLSLDDPISRFFPDFPQPAARATVRQLLNHSSGVLDYSKIPGWIARQGAQPRTTADLVAEVRNRPAKSEPGANWEYNNAGYMMLGAIVEEVTGQAWHEAVTERIARPLRLTSLLYFGTPKAQRLMASGYSGEGDRQSRARGADASVAHASGGLAGSVSDLAKWAQALHHGRVVRPELYKEMTKAAQLADGSTRPYGFGLRLQRLRGRPVLVHGGAGAGLDTDSVYIPSEDLYVAVLSNSEDAAMDASTLTRRLAALAIGEPMPMFSRAEVALSDVEPLFGAYLPNEGAELRFFARDGKLYLASGQDEMEALPAGDDRFFFGPDRLTWVRFTRKPDSAHVMEVHEGHAAGPERAVRTGPVPPPLTVSTAILQTYVGTYQTETVTVTVAIGPNGWPTIQPSGGPVMPMRPVSNTEFRVDAGGFRLVFHPENGRVDRLTMFRGARELHGRRTGP